MACPTCKSSGFNVSSLGKDRCTFCDGTEGGSPPPTNNPNKADIMANPSDKPFFLLLLEQGNFIGKVGGLNSDEAQAAVSKLNEVSESDKSHHYIQGVRDMADELKQLCKDFSDRQNRPYMGDVYSAVDGLRDQMISSVPVKPVPPQAPPKTPEEIAAQREFVTGAFKDLC